VDQPDNLRHALPPAAAGAPHNVAPLSRLRWVMIGLAFPATVINYLDRQTLSVVAPILREEFDMSREAYGLVVSAFMLAYAIMNGVSGPMLDRLGTRLGYAVSSAWWSTAALLHVLTRGPWSLGCSRFLLGMGEAAIGRPPSNWWPNGSRPASERWPLPSGSPSISTACTGSASSGSA